jgi:hypothetical protein
MIITYGSNLLRVAPCRNYPCNVNSTHNICEWTVGVYFALYTNIEEQRPAELGLLWSNCVSIQEKRTSLVTSIIT